MELSTIVKKSRIFPVIRASSKDSAVKIIDAILLGGINVIELTMSIPGAISLIKDLADKYKGKDVIIGAGTILDSISARLAILAGAKFVVSPILNEEMIKVCNLYNIPIIPGTATPTEMIKATNLGASAVKVFPADSFGGARYIKNVLNPLPHLRLVPTGGVNLDTIGEYFNAGAFAVGVGSALVDKKAIKEGNYSYITEIATKFLEEVKKP